VERPRNPDLAQRLFGGRPEHTLALVKAAWPAAVGPELARRTEVVALDRGLLRVKVGDAGWQRTLVRMRGEILVRLARVAGGAAPRALGFVVGEVAVGASSPRGAPASPGDAGSPGGAVDRSSADPVSPVRTELAGMTGHASTGPAPTWPVPALPAAVVAAAGAMPDDETRALFLRAAAAYLARFRPGQAGGGSGGSPGDGSGGAPAAGSGEGTGSGEGPAAA
jgi:hypothetical protein